jgi:hypothetical protein
VLSWWQHLNFPSQTFTKLGICCRPKVPYWYSLTSWPELIVVTHGEYIPPGTRTVNLLQNRSKSVHPLCVNLWSCQWLVKILGEFSSQNTIPIQEKQTQSVIVLYDGRLYESYKRLEVFTTTGMKTIRSEGHKQKLVVKYYFLSSWPIFSKLSHVPQTIRVVVYCE